MSLDRWGSTVNLLDLLVKMDELTEAIEGLMWSSKMSPKIFMSLKNLHYEMETAIELIDKLRETELLK